jgi:hypothetical protein
LRPANSFIPFDLRRFAFQRSRIFRVGGDAVACDPKQPCTVFNDVRKTRAAPD